MKPIEKLTRMKACDDALDYAKQFVTIEEIIDNCHRGDWLLWLAQKLRVDKRKIILAMGHCTNTVRHLMKDERSTKAVDAEIAYGEGKIDDDELNVAANIASAAADAAYAAYNDVACNASSSAADITSAAAYNAAASSAASVTSVATVATAYNAASTAAAASAYNATSVASVATVSSATTKNQLETADICRKYLRQDLIELFNIPKEGE